MGTIVISASFESGFEENAFLKAAEALLKGMGANVQQYAGEQGVVMTASYKTLPPPTAPTPPPESVPAEVTPAPEPAPQPEPENVSSDPALSLVTLKNLSSVYTVPFSIDTSLPCSQLNVQGLSQMGESVSFSYCSMTYKLPAEKAETTVGICNEDPQFTPTTIRTIADFGSDRGALSLLVKLVEGDECRIIFGKDVADLVKKTIENATNGEVPA